MRPLDFLRGAAKKQRELGERGELYNRLQAYVGEAEEQRDELCWKAVDHAFDLMGGDSRGIVGRAAYQLCQDILALEGHLYLPAIDINKSFTMVEMWELTATIKNALVPFEEQDKRDYLLGGFTLLLQRLCSGLPQITVQAGDEWASLSVPLHVLLPDPVKAIETAIEMPLIMKFG